ncbi:WXG100 family type VII secretion target [Streptomyces sp. CCM_MD2014]|uniref:WXG100 family type VII secretion target n=1 Tax=Streptomyces sp. CCM_MD2014 TaxID=1561022 RepID=UPI00099BEC90|nr:WXG100 family type VII secretion target [Streptomyces sp. CCM_MD2014]
MSDKRHEADYDRISRQNTAADLTRGLEERPSFGLFGGILKSAVESTPLGSAMRGRTNFENHDLNEMVDLVEQTNPEDLESSGKALWDARDAIKEAAKELDGHIGNVRWVGEAGEAFRKWGRALVTSTHGLSAFAGGAGDQITAAAVGLANVRTAMPERDTRPTSKALRPEQLPAPKQVEGNSEYAEAVRVEKNRQEAINQMNRLSSYYAVSEELLAGMEPPKFTAMPDVGVPKPQKDYRIGMPDVRQPGPVQERESGSFTGDHSRTVMEDRARPNTTDGTADASGSITQPAVYTDVPIATNIDSVGTPTLPTAPVPGPALPTTLPPGDGGGPTGPFGPSFGSPLPPGRSGRADGGPGRTRAPFSAQGRVTPPAQGGGPGRQGGQGPFNQVGRPTPAGQQPVARGIASGAKPSLMGPGVSGGTPRPNPAMAPRPAGGPVTGAGRTGGVVGGRPTSTTGATGRSGPKLPRGTVVGADAGSQPGKGRSTAKPGITGAPTGAGSAARAERNGMTRGGAGLVRGPGGRGRRRDERREEGAERPDYLVEDEETHLPTNPRRDVPPVVN